MHIQCKKERYTQRHKSQNGRRHPHCVHLLSPVTRAQKGGGEEDVCRWRDTRTVHVVAVRDHVLEVLTVSTVVFYAGSNVRKDHNIPPVTFSDSTKFRVRMSLTRSTFTLFNTHTHTHVRIRVHTRTRRWQPHPGRLKGPIRIGDGEI